ncbi:Ig-like domain-containing protein [Azospirillum canadense]|uniref:Ig-like domain-containing protein n=1 Tax=Azospirillum canadense TaxID=403962 RepID=UPI00222672BA|nr:Ig-like domain-containing protein [Azospirillum canadense]MCW2241332.1 Ca2+-binding RTX toxin-like protein [Azospirillum canadense]
MTLAPTQAALGTTAAGQATVATAIDGTVTITGSVGNVNATLANLRITGGTSSTATIAVTVSDGATTPATGTLTLPMVDTTLPGSPTITAASTDAGTLPVTLTDRNRLYVRGNAEANSRVVLSDGGTEVATVTADARRAWVVDLSAAPLVDGTHAFTARAADAAGNTGSVSTALSVVVDTVAPSTPSVAFTGGTIDRAKQTSVGFVLSSAEVGTTYRWTLASSGGGSPLSGTGTVGNASDTVGGINVSALADGTLSLSVTLTDAAGNASAVGAATVTKAAGTLVDGAQVQTSAGQANGKSVSTVMVQATTDGRAEDPGTPNAGLADVPLLQETVTDPTSGLPVVTTTLQVGLPTGVGVTASGPTNREAPSPTLADLIREIEAHTAAGSASRTDLEGGGASFLNALPQQASLLLRTLAFTAPGTPGAAVRVTGATQATTTPTALVMDTTGATGPLTIQLDRVEFAAVIGSATLTGGEGNNVVYGDSSSQSLILGPGDDLLSGPGDDLLSGPRDDLLSGGGNDTVASTLGNDTLYGDAGDDLMNGGDGDDLMDGGADNDLMGGGAGRDTMGGGAGNDVLIGEGGDDALFGGTGSDSLFGGAGHEALFGEDGNDTLFGGVGDDVMSGGAGDDLLFLDQGADTVWGGAGADTFALGGSSGGAMVMDFIAGTDRLALFDPTLDLKSVIASARVVNGNTVIDLRPGASVTIVGQAGVGQAGVGQAGDVSRWFA